jgi:hypothetical protein
MTLGYYGLLLPILELAAVWWLVSRIYYSRYYVLLAYLTVEALSQIITITSLDWWALSWATSQPLRMVLRAAVVFDVFKMSCIRMTRAQQYRVAAYTVTFSLLAYGITASFIPLKPIESLGLFRMWFHLILTASLVGLTVYIWRHPILENRDHRTYRLVMTATFVRMCITLTFVKGGFGYLFFQYSLRTWRIVDGISWILAMLLVILLAWGMTSNISCLRPDVAERVRARRASRQKTDLSSRWERA